MRAIGLLLLGWFWMVGAQAQEPIRFGVEGAYPPFSFKDDSGRLQGFDIDVAYALCEILNRPCELVEEEWDLMIPSLLEGKYDAILASMSITIGRQQVVDFTDKYYQTPARFVRRKGSGVDILAEALRGRRIGVQASTTHDNFASDLFGHLVKVVRYPTQEDVYAAIGRGEVDLILGDSISVRDGFLRTAEGAAFEFVGPYFTDAAWMGEGAGIAVRKREDGLREALNAGIRELRDSGRYQRIQGKYFNFDIYGEDG